MTLPPLLFQPSMESTLLTQRWALGRWGKHSVQSGLSNTEARAPAVPSTQLCRVPPRGPPRSPSPGLDPSPHLLSLLSLSSLSTWPPLPSHVTRLLLTPSSYSSDLLSGSGTCTVSPLSSKSSCCCFCLEHSPSCPLTSRYLGNSHSASSLREGSPSTSDLTKGSQGFPGTCSALRLSSCVCPFATVSPGPNTGCGTQQQINNYLLN